MSPSENIPSVPNNTNESDCHGGNYPGSTQKDQITVATSGCIFQEC